MKINIFEGIFDIFEGLLDILDDIMEGITDFLFDKLLSIPRYINNSYHALVYYLKCKLFYPHRVIIDSPQLPDEPERPIEWSIENFGSENVFLHAEPYLSDRGYLNISLHYNFKKRSDALHFKMVWKT